jgi:hypothetical protein
MSFFGQNNNNQQQPNTGFGGFGSNNNNNTNTGRPFFLLHPYVTFVGFNDIALAFPRHPKNHPLTPLLVAFRLWLNPLQ